MKLHIVFLISVAFVSFICASDTPSAYRISKSYRPENPPIIKFEPPQPIKRDYTFTEQLLRDEIRACGIMAIRKRMQEAIVEADRMRGQTDLCFGPHYFLTINRTFYATSTDPLSRSIFDKASKDGAQVWTLEREIDDNTDYRVIDDTRQTIECRTNIHSQAFIEKVINDVEQNG